MKIFDILKKLEGIQKQYYTFYDLKKIIGMDSPSLRVRLNRLVKSGLLVRLSRGAYAVYNKNTNIDKLANEIVCPSYLSFEYALAKQGVISETPFEIELATTKKTSKRIIAGTSVSYRKIDVKLFFGYELKGGVYIAEAEKAFLDSFYLKVFGKNAGFDPGKVDLKKLNRNKITTMIRPYPGRVKKAVLEFLKNSKKKHRKTAS